jgi:hypothetical protein
MILLCRNKAAILSLYDKSLASKQTVADVGCKKEFKVTQLRKLQQLLHGASPSTFFS